MTSPQMARPPVAQPHCGAREVLWGSSCYFFSQDAQTWEDAQAFCERKGDGLDHGGRG